MRPFGTGETYRSSIALDASTHGNVTVASAVYSTRECEIEILQHIIDEFRDIEVDFIPFKTKSKRVAKDEHEDTYRRIIQNNTSRISLLQFRHQSAEQNQHYTEAVLTAILSAKIVANVDDEALIIVDGDQHLLKRFGNAYYEIAGELPLVTNCIRSEWYYPQSLLADLSAGFIAYRIENGLYDYDEPVIRARRADRKFSEEWGRAFDFLQRNPDVDVDTVPVRTGRSDTPEGRAELWYLGGMGRTAASETQVHISTVISRMEELGYTAVAEALSEV